MDRVGLEVESNGLRLQEVGRNLEELAAFKAEAANNLQELASFRTEAADSLDMIKRELTESAEVIKQEMAEVFSSGMANVTENMVELRYATEPDQRGRIFFIGQEAVFLLARQDIFRV
jgi:hypothetical protein